MSPLVREYVQLCTECSEVTPHSRRLIAFPKIGAVACVLVAAWSLYGDIIGWILAGLLLGMGLLLLVRDRDKCWRIRCERCRWQRISAIRRTQPTLDGNTEINIF